MVNAKGKGTGHLGQLHWLQRKVKGQLGVPLTYVYPGGNYLFCSLGNLGDNLPINTLYIGLILI